MVPRQIYGAWTDIHATWTDIYATWTDTHATQTDTYATQMDTYDLMADKYITSLLLIKMLKAFIRVNIKSLFANPYYYK